MWVNNSTAMYRYGATVAERRQAVPILLTAAGRQPLGGHHPGHDGASSQRSGRLFQHGVGTRRAGQSPPSTPTRAGSDISAPGATNSSPSGFPVNMLSYIAQLNAGPRASRCWGRHRPGPGGGHQARWRRRRQGWRAHSAPEALAPRGALGVSVLVGKLSMPPAVVGMLPGCAAAGAARLGGVRASVGGGPGRPRLPMVPSARRRWAARVGAGATDETTTSNTARSFPARS